MSLPCRVLGFFLICGLSSTAQQRRIDMSQTYERVYAAVPLIGQGTWADPKRPMFAPAPSAVQAGDRSGVVAFHYVISDDGKTALTEFVFHDRAALTLVMETLRAQPSVKAFDSGKDSKAAIETFFKTLKKDFDISKFTVRVP